MGVEQTPSPEDEINMKATKKAGKFCQIVKITLLNGQNESFSSVSG